MSKIFNEDKYIIEITNGTRKPVFGAIISAFFPAPEDFRVRTAKFELFVL